MGGLLCLPDLVMVPLTTEDCAVFALPSMPVPGQPLTLNPVLGPSPVMPFLGIFVSTDLSPKSVQHL